MSEPSDHKTGGYISRQVAQNTAHAGVRIAELTAVIIDDTTDGDNDNRRAIRAAGEIAELAVHLCDSQWKVADGNYGEAKKASQSLIEERHNHDHN